MKTHKNQRIFRTFAAALTALLCGSGPLLAQSSDQETGQHPKSFTKEITTTLSANYLLYLPDGYEEAAEDWPLLLFLHGIGERGENLTLVEKHGPPMLVAREGRAFPFVILSPQCPADDWWGSETQMATLDALLEDVVARYRIDEDRIYVTGLSMGGSGAFHLATAYPKRFAAIAPIGGGGIPEKAASIAHLPIWVFYGAEDSAARIERIDNMVDALRAAGSNVEVTAYPDLGHNAWGVTYEGSRLYEWFLEHTRSASRSDKPAAH